MHNDPIGEYRAERERAVLALESLEETNDGLDPLLAEQLELERAVLKKLDEAIDLAQNPERRRRSQPMLILPSEPTPGADEVAVCVIRDALGAQLENASITIGTVGTARVVWNPSDGGLGFIPRRDFAKMRRVHEVEQVRVVTLDGRNGWGDLHRLVTDAPAKVRHIGDLALAVVRATRSTMLLKAWLAHARLPDGLRDPQFMRVVEQQLKRVEAAAAAE